MAFIFISLIKEAMLVPAMTLEDIRKEVDRELLIVRRKSAYVSLKLQKQYAQRIKKEPMIFYFNYLSKYKNTWIYMIRLHRKESTSTFMVYYHGHKGLTAIMPIEPDQMVYITAHFLNRYNDRKGLRLVQPGDIIKAFMLDTQIFHVKELEETAPGVSKIFVIADSGYMLGMHNKKLRLFKFNTYITADMLHPDQHKIEGQLNEYLEKYKDHSAKLD